MDLGLRDKNAIVTGGSKGIGAGICRVLAQEGCNIAVNYRSDREAAEKFAKELSDCYGVKTIAVQADVTSEEASETLFETAQKELGQIQILINNAAGGISFKNFEDYTTEEWKQAQQGVLDHVFFLTRRFVKEHKKNGGIAHVVNLLSKSAVLSSSTQNLTYVANKGALISLTRGMAKEFLPYGIYVNGIVPGYVKTEQRHASEDERTIRVRKLLPTGEFATPEDMGYMVAFLCSLKSRQTIGAIIDCTGGTLI